MRSAACWSDLARTRQMTRRRRGDPLGGAESNVESRCAPSAPVAPVKIYRQKDVSTPRGKNPYMANSQWSDRPE